MFLLIDYRIKILIFSDISKFFRSLFRTLFRTLFRPFLPPDRVLPHPCRALSCIIARHSPTSVRKVQTALRKVLPLSYRQREGRFRTSSPDYPENPEKPTGGYLSNDWSMQLNRPHDPPATTGRCPGNDWSMQLNRPHISLASTGQYLSIDWSMQEWPEPESPESVRNLFINSLFIVLC